jgi:gamma-glutamylcyclotransferase (GGCT)/AIG2-like uncharacterized protein YtfP
MTIQHHIFVYGTLKRGQCREQCWPVPPISIVAAWTLGAVYDLGPYPAMIAGSSRIAGQLWTYSESQIDAVRKELDCIEVTNQPGYPNEYDRVEIEVNLLDGSKLLAETYLFSRPAELTKIGRLVPSSLTLEQAGYVIWPISSPWLEAI